MFHKSAEDTAMIIIRREQMETFENAAMRTFEDRMLVHLRENHPDKIKDMNDEQLRSLIRQGIQQAETHEVVIEWDVCRYLDLVVLHGLDFDESPETTWAGEILRSKELDGTGKMDRIDHYEKFCL